MTVKLSDKDKKSFRDLTGIEIIPFQNETDKIIDSYDVACIVILEISDAVNYFYCLYFLHGTFAKGV